MAKKAKKNPDTRSGQPGQEGAKEEKVSEPVKLRPTFKMRLQRVAIAHGLDMGILIENVMADYINREYKVVIEKELEELRDQ